MGYFSLALLQEKKQQEQKNKSKNTYLFSLIADIYQHNLLTEAGQGVWRYLHGRRQITRELIDRFSHGCSIDGRQISTLLYPLQSDKFTAQDLLNINLV